MIARAGRPREPERVALAPGDEAWAIIIAARGRSGAGELLGVASVRVDRVEGAEIVFTLVKVSGRICAGHQHRAPRAMLYANSIASERRAFKRAVEMFYRDGGP